MSKKEILSLSDFSFSYEGSDKPVLHRLTFTLYQGESVALLGPSGVGKSTLLRHLYTELSENASLIHQDYSLVPQLSIFHNIYMGRLEFNSTAKNLRNLILPQKVTHNEVEKIAQRLQIDEKLSKRCDKISGGQQQRVSIGRALYRDAEINLADEPVSAIDPANADRVLEALMENGKTTVASMHNVSLAKKQFSRLIGLKSGQILFDIASEDLTDSLLTALYSE